MLRPQVKVDLGTTEEVVPRSCKPPHQMPCCRIYPGRLIVCTCPFYFRVSLDVLVGYEDHSNE